MNDEAFYLTPLDVRRYEFGNALRGYDKARVDQFRDQVADELERLTRLNQDLEAKAKGFHEQLRAFRERDKALNEALVSAQQLRGDIREQAEREGLLILREARAEGERIVADARAHVRALASEVDALDRARRQYLAQMRILVERQLAELDAVGAAGPPSRHTPVALPSLASHGHLSPHGNVASHGPPGSDGPVSPGLPTPAFLEVTEGA
jgi:DivIVA domain-containing protein